MFKHFKMWFIPHTHNAYEPHFLRAWSVVAILLVVFLFFALAHVADRALTSSHGYLAAVVSSVLVDLTNFNRADAGLHGLIINPVLTQAAQLKARHMAEYQYFAHNAPDGTPPWFWFHEVGYEFAYAGENLAIFFGDSKDVVDAWMSSPSHRANLLGSNFTEIGIATVEGFYQGRPTVFVVQLFGAPRYAGSNVGTLATETPITPIAQSDTLSDEVPPARVGGESVQILSEADIEPTQSRVEPALELSIVHENETFIAVKGEGHTVPSAGSVTTQSALWERMLASPYTILSYMYTVIAGVVTAALIFLIFFEIRTQRPKNILYAIVILVSIGALFYLSYAEVVVANSLSVHYSPGGSR
jgi:uncharacterized protein YkwD